MSKQYPFTLEPLPYEYEALEPVLNAETLHFHHDKHLQTYVDNLNKALEPFEDYHHMSLEKLITQYADLPEGLKTSVRNNGGGVYNHELYFKCMGKHSGKPSGELAKAIDESFQSFEDWKKQMKEAALTQFGSGWAWLVKTREGALRIVKTLNQDTPLPEGSAPLLLVDVWEHAYYLQYQNRRAEYLDNWFNIINWEQVEKNYESCSCGCNHK